jgi:hypothetical protein
MDTVVDEKPLSFATSRIVTIAGAYAGTHEALRDFRVRAAA